MAYILTLANELLSEIFLYAEPEDLAHLAAAHPILHDVAQPLLQKYQALADKFHCMIHPPNPTFWYWHNVANSILTGSEGVRFIKKIFFNQQRRRMEAHDSWPRTFTDWDPVEDCPKEIKLHMSPLIAGRRHDESDDPDLGPLENAIDSFPWFENEPNSKAHLKTNLRFGYLSSLQAVLLPSLPKLREISVYASPEVCLSDLRRVVEYAAITHGRSLPCTSFSNLTSVHFETPAVHAGKGYSLSFLEPFMALPSIKKVSAIDVEGYVFSRNESLPRYNVTDLSLSQLRCPALEFAALLENARPLKNLVLDFAPMVRPLDTGLIGRTLLGNAKYSLEKLWLDATISGRFCQPIPPGIQLKEFTNLTDIVICFKFLLIHPDQHLSDVLPPSLESLVITTMPSDQATVVLPVLEHKQTMFPKLSSLQIFPSLDPRMSLRISAVCMEHEVTWWPPVSPRPNNFRDSYS